MTSKDFLPDMDVLNMYPNPPPLIERVEVIGLEPNSLRRIAEALVVYADNLEKGTIIVTGGGIALRDRPTGIILHADLKMEYK